MVIACSVSRCFDNQDVLNDVLKSEVLMCCVQHRRGEYCRFLNKMRSLGNISPDLMNDSP